MKRILILLFILCSFEAIGQAPASYTYIAARYRYFAGVMDSGFVVPRFSTTPYIRTGTFNGAGHVGVDTVNHRFYWYSGGSWRYAATGGATGTSWSTTGNTGTTAGTNFIGTTDAIDFVVKTNATERMRTLSTGNVGIGDASPASMFTVGSGDLFQVDNTGNIVKTRNVTTSWPSSQGAANTILLNDGSGNFSWTATLPSGLVPTLQQTITAGSTLTTSNTIVNGANILTITNNSMVERGVMITSNSTLSDGSDEQILLYSILSGAHSLSGIQSIAVEGQNLHTGTNSSNIGVNGSASGGTTNIGGKFSGSGGTNNYALITAGGDIGLGTSAPTSPIDMIANNSTGNVALIRSTTTTSGTILNIIGTSTALASGNEGLNIAISGANGTNAITATGARISVTNTNVTSGTNVGLDLTASGATTANNALNIAAGAVTLNGSAGTSGQVLTSAGANTLPTWSTPSAGSPAGNFGNVQINRNGAFAVAGSDSLDFESATGLSVKGNTNVSGSVGLGGTAVTTIVTSGITKAYVYGAQGWDYGGLKAYLEFDGGANSYLVMRNGSSANTIQLATASSPTYFNTGSNFGIGTASPNSTLHANGSVSYAYTAQTTTYPITATDYAINCTSGTFTATLPTAVGITGRIYFITNSGAGTVTLATTSSQTFANVVATPTTLPLATLTGIVVMSDGANWLKVSSF